VAGLAEAKEEVLDVDSARVGLFRSAGAGEAVVWVFAGDGAGGGAWTETAVRLPVDKVTGQALTWHRLTVGEDGAGQTWQLWVDGVQVASELGFQVAREPATPVCILMGDHREAVFVDDFGIWSQLPAAVAEPAAAKATMAAAASAPAAKPADADGDSLPDAWERTYGLNPVNSADGNADPDKDGLVNRDEFALGTDPRKADILAAHLPPPRTEVFSRFQFPTIRRGKAVDARRPYDEATD
jgi:hypothetical protein